MITQPNLELEKLETEIAGLLIEKLENQEMGLARASQIAKFVLQALPQSTPEDKLQEIVLMLDDEFYELAAIVNKHIAEYENVEKPVVMTEVDGLVKQQKFEEAHQKMQEYLEKVVNKKVATP